MGGQQGSLQASLQRADSQVTLLDDRIDAEEHAEWLWLKAHVLPGYANHRIVIGTEPLSFPWLDQTRKCLDAHAADAYLRHFRHNKKAMAELTVVARTLNPGRLHPLAAEEVIATVVAALMRGQAWLIDLPKAGIKSRYTGKTDPAAFAPINPRFGTQVDFAFIARLEGDQWRRGYVPMRKGIVVGNSGMTIASGFDLGQWLPKDFDNMNFTPELVKKLKPFAKPNSFKNLTKAQVALKVGKIASVPEINKQEADSCDAAVFANKLDMAIKRWDRSHGAGVPDFVSLPSGWQTVWLSRVYQGKTAAFATPAFAGKWTEAIAALRADNQYPERTNQEADLLETELPPPVKPPSAGSPK